MKTKEFIERVEDLGYDTCVSDYEIEVYWSDGPEQYDVGSVRRKEINAMDTACELTTSDDLFNLFIEYAKTPVTDREEAKKFYLKHRWISFRSGEERYLNFDRIADKNIYYLDTKNSVELIDTQFTQAEIDDMKRRLNTNFEDFEQVEVEE